MPCFRLIVLLVLLAPAIAHAAATVSLKAVARNGAAIAPTNDLNVVPGDLVTAEVYLSGWSNPPYDAPANTGLVQTYQVTLEGAYGASSNGGDFRMKDQLALPSGWDAPVVKDTCPCDLTSFPDCDLQYGCIDASSCIGGSNPGAACTRAAQCMGGGTCDQSGHYFANMAAQTSTRPDWLFFGYSTFHAIDFSTLNIKWGGTINGPEGQLSSRCAGGPNADFSCTTSNDCSGSTCDANYQSYAGTLNLKLGSHACGTYTFTFDDNPNNTFISNTEPIAVTSVPAIEPLVLTTGISCPVVPTGACCDTTNPAAAVCSILPVPACLGGYKRYGGDNSTCADIDPPCENTILSVTPAHCTVDARVPYPPNTPASRQGFTSMTLTFLNSPGSEEDAPADFQVTQVPATTPPIPPTISSVVTGAGNTVVINFDVPIQPLRWTCVRHIASNSRQCLGFLPADASSNLFAAPADILDIVDNLNGIRVPTLLPHQCDIDRDGVCAPADILSELDLLSGTNGFTSQNGRSLPPCPSTTP